MFYGVWLVFGMSIVKTVTIYPHVQTLSAWTSVSFVALVDETAMSLDFNDVTRYAWYIDGVPVENMQTASLTIEWETYTSLFPDEVHQDMSREVFVQAIQGDEIISDNARLEIDYQENVCGDTIVQYTSWEECDDGNMINGDGCNTSCLCEWICVSLIGQE